MNTQSEIERYELVVDGDTKHHMLISHKHTNGDWCYYSDVEKLIKQNQDLIETIQAMIKIGEAVK